MRSVALVQTPCGAPHVVAICVGRSPLSFVIAGLVPAIPLRPASRVTRRDGRDEPGHDEASIQRLLSACGLTCVLVMFTIALIENRGFAIGCLQLKERFCKTNPIP